jgi:hypothetical protein
MCMDKALLLGNTRPFGCQIQIYTERGWVICDDEKDLQEERNRIEVLEKDVKKN